MQIDIRYIDKHITRLVKLPQGDLIDLRASRVIVNGEEMTLPCTYKVGDIVFIKLGVAMRLPKGYKANLYPRSSTFKNYGLILTNSVGQIDNSYNGNGDEWGAMCYALKDGTINYDDRICQFDIQRTTMDNIALREVDKLEEIDRGGYGSTGTR